MSNSNDTPRTDAWHAEWQEKWDKGILSPDLCRQLERELAESRAYADKLAAGLPVGMPPKDIELLRDSNAQLAARVNEMEEDVAMLDWLDSDAGRIAKMSDGWNSWAKGDLSYTAIKPIARDAIRSAMRQEGTK